MRPTMNGRDVSVSWRELAIGWALAAGVLLALVLASDHGPRDMVGMLNGIMPATAHSAPADTVRPASAIPPSGCPSGLDACSSIDYANERC